MQILRHKLGCFERNTRTFSTVIYGGGSALIRQTRWNYIAFPMWYSAYCEGEHLYSVITTEHPPLTARPGRVVECLQLRQKE